ncbi:hypothetical protein ZHAS_00005721 [Anopheles sinensis]|uniref:Uncharacterized protein n=1 Tax=Anopheles sinensis TaxID=74873 RepID=A0A084VK72_ANOSI|nr:hypothetical protein ZHAS_00005721 [Anopheles sinensis]
MLFVPSRARACVSTGLRYNREDVRKPANREPRTWPEPSTPGPVQSAPPALRRFYSVRYSTRPCVCVCRHWVESKTAKLHRKAAKKNSATPRTEPRWEREDFVALLLALVSGSEENDFAHRTSRANSKQQMERTRKNSRTVHLVFGACIGVVRRNDHDHGNTGDDDNDNDDHTPYPDG